MNAMQSRRTTFCPSGSHSLQHPVQFRSSLCAFRSNKGTAVCGSAQAKTSKPERNSVLRFCEICGTGVGSLPCSVCHGSGERTTQPGGAGRQFYVGIARCRQCNGLGHVACPMCAGWERSRWERCLDDVHEAEGTNPADLAWLDNL